MHYCSGTFYIHAAKSQVISHKEPNFMLKHCGSYGKQNLRMCMEGEEKKRAREKKRVREKKGKEDGRKICISQSVVSENVLPLACLWFVIFFSDFLMTSFLIHKSGMIRINILTVKKPVIIGSYKWLAPLSTVRKWFSLRFKPHK